ncbi:response regulator [Roseobacter sp. YSTF-M11]|uniref:Response regulator n=1 Tax=Roseobacter insulae TaxID=2859783 RepID=A0A9X1FZD3_9RHOB|nr:response regulator [Roseobacter insulae]MBW4710422.1 response regulator [Roseobacter insulae]
MLDILLMEDDTDLASVLRDVLESRGFTVTISASATEAFAAIKTKKFDLLITDIIVQKNRKSIPDGGISLISKLRGPLGWELQPWMKTMPIIAISGAIHNQGMSNLLTISRDLGADLTLAKPIEIDALIHAINLLTRKTI